MAANTCTKAQLLVNYRDNSSHNEIICNTQIAILMKDDVDYAWRKAVILD